MTDLTRRDALKTLGVVSAGAFLPPVTESATTPPDPPLDAGLASPDGTAQSLEILPLSSTSEVFVPPRGNAFQKFSFDFPEPSVEFGGYRFSALLFTRENAYGMDRERMKAETTPNGLRVTCDRLVWAGGQERATGRVTMELRRTANGLECDISAQSEHPVKSVTLVVRGVPRGRVSAGYDFFDPKDDEVLFGYPFSGGDLFGPGAAGGMTTPLLMIRKSDTEHFFISSLDDRVRAKRFYLQPGASSYRLDAVWEAEGWKSESAVRVPTWRIGTVREPNDALNLHYAHVVRAYRLPAWGDREDVPAWLRQTALATTLHGQHYTGYIFNDYAKMLETLRWMATEIPPERVLVFLAAWDGRYYWDYPKYQVDPRMGGEDGFRQLIHEGQRLGFKMMPMYGCNAANRKQPIFQRLADAATAKIDGDVMDLNWVDWDNDRHQDGWLAYMNLGVDSWREHLTARIADMVDRFGVDAYFLDIAGGWTNNPRADMHEGTRRMIADLRTRYPHVLACGEMHYDALLEFIPLYHAGGGGPAGPIIQRHARFFQHLSHPAPGRGSSGVHESGFGSFNDVTLSLAATAIPTLNIVDDTFTKYREQMRAVIRKAKERAGIG
jgi:hypothetical protein